MYHSNKALLILNMHLTYSLQPELFRFTRSYQMMQKLKKQVVSL